MTSQVVYVPCLSNRIGNIYIAFLFVYLHSIKEVIGKDSYLININIVKSNLIMIFLKMEDVTTELHEWMYYHMFVQLINDYILSLSIEILG